MRLALLTLACLTAAASLHAQVSARFDPVVVNVGERAVYRLTLNFSGNLQGGDLPQPEGLEIATNPFRRSSFTNVVNGAISQGIHYDFAVQTSQPGTFSMPAWQARIDGKLYTVPAASLRVVPHSEELTDAFFLRLELEAEDAYVGQPIPLNLRLLVREDIEGRLLEKVPNPAGEADFFRQALFDEPQLARETIDGTPYQSLTWSGLLTPLKAGSFPLAYTLEVALNLPDSRRDRISPLFSRPTNVRLATESAQLTVHDLPEPPANVDFSGAIGSFSLEVAADSLEIPVGDPLTLTARVSGQGNFDRLGEPTVLDDGSAWRLYPAKSSFSSSDPSGYTGTKSFEFILIPLDESVTETPALSLTFFDPSTAEYRTLTAPPQYVEVLPGPEYSAPAPVVLSAEDPPATSDDTPPFQPIVTQPGSWTSSITPAFLRPSFLATQAATGALILFAAWWQRRQHRLASDASLRAARHARRLARQHLAKARTCARRKHPADFFEHACRCLQASAFALEPHRTEPTSLTARETAHIAATFGCGADAQADILACFEARDALRFGGGQHTLDDLPAWRGKLSRLHASLDSAQPTRSR